MHGTAQCRGSNTDNTTSWHVLELLPFDILGLTEGCFRLKSGRVGDESGDYGRARCLGGEEGGEVCLGEGLGGVVVD